MKSYLAENTNVIKTISPDSTDYTDLEKIGSAISNAKVVMLGEQDHGDAPTFLAKTRLIKYLHEKKGFNVIAFESDFFGLNYGWDHLSKQHPAVDEFIKNNIFPIWSVCNTCSDLLYNYIPATYKTANPLILSGFDNQQYLNYSYNNLASRLDSVLRTLHLPVTTQVNYRTEILPLIDSIPKWTYVTPHNTIGLDKSISYLNLIHEQLATVVKADDFWLYVLANQIVLANEVRQTVLKGKTFVNERDIQMAINLKWLMENKFKGKKIIVWAADYHIAKAIKSVKGDYKNTETMGTHLVANVADPGDVYILGFTSYQGKGGRFGFPAYEVKHPVKNSFETWFDTGINYAFVDFSKFNTLYPDNDDYFYCAALGHYVGEGKWNRVLTVCSI